MDAGAEWFYTEVAESCLEEGCPLETVEELILKLKAEKNPSAAMVSAINSLQSLVASPDANKNEIEKIVASAARSSSVVDGFTFPGEPTGYTGKVGTTTDVFEALEQ